MDIGKLQDIAAHDDEGVTITIYQRNGDPYLASDGSEATMTVVGSESARYRKAERQQQRRLFKRARNRSVEITPEETEAEALELAAAAVVDWHGWEAGGKPAPCDAEHVQAVLKYKHIFEQVNRAIQDGALFFAGRSDD